MKFTYKTDTGLSSFSKLMIYSAITLVFFLVGVYWVKYFDLLFTKVPWNNLRESISMSLIFIPALLFIAYLGTISSSEVKRKTEANQTTGGYLIDNYFIISGYLDTAILQGEPVSTLKKYSLEHVNLAIDINNINSILLKKSKVSIDFTISNLELSLNLTNYFEGAYTIANKITQKAKELDMELHVHDLNNKCTFLAKDFDKHYHSFYPTLHGVRYIDKEINDLNENNFTQISKILKGVKIL